MLRQNNPLKKTLKITFNQKSRFLYSYYPYKFLFFFLVYKSFLVKFFTTDIFDIHNCISRGRYFKVKYLYIIWTYGCISIIKNTHVYIYTDLYCYSTTYALKYIIIWMCHDIIATISQSQKPNIYYNYSLVVKQGTPS